VAHQPEAAPSWLQLNLLTAFLAAAVVGIFQGTIDRLVILALFLPVLAGQSGNTGCQALAVTLRASRWASSSPARSAPSSPRKPGSVASMALASDSSLE